MIVLASASPRRRELLEKYGIEYELLITDADESVKEQLDPEYYVMAVSRRKAEAAVKITATGRARTIVAADTIVCIDGRILGKPKDRQDALEMLTSLSGRRHIVYTGLCVAFTNGGVKYSQDFCATKVTFKPLSFEQIEQYLKTGEPYDKAGAYAIQGEGAKLIEKIDGDYDNVVGLPVERLLDILRENGCDY